MNRSNLLRLFLIGWAVVAVSCVDAQNDGGTTTGNPLVETAMTNSANTNFSTVHFKWPWLKIFSPLKSQAAPPAGVIQDSVGNSIGLSQAYAVVKEVEFKEAEVASEIESPEVQYVGPFVVNLFADQPTSFGLAPAVLYPVRRIKMKFHRLEIVSGDTPSEVLNNSLWLSATKNGQAFQVAIDEGFEFEVAGPNGIALSNGELLLITLKLPALFTQIDLSAVVAGDNISSQDKIPATNPCPTLNASAQDIYTCFKDGLKFIGNAGIDSSRDGELDPEDNTVD